MNVIREPAPLSEIPARVRSRGKAWLRHTLGTALTLTIVILGVLALHDELPRAIHLLAGVGPGHITVGVVLEAASLIAYTMVTRTLLSHLNRPPFTTLLRIDLTVYGVSHVVPGGGLTAAALRVRMLTKAGARLTDAEVLVAFQGIGGVVVLGALLEFTLLVFAPSHAGDPVAVTAACGALVLAAVAGAAVLVIRRRPGWLFGVAGNRPGRWSPVEKVLTEITAIGVRLQVLGSRRSRLVAATGWIAANWLLDAAALWVVLAAYGHSTDLAALVAAYCLANVLAALPLTPGGLGVIEAVLISTLAVFGVPISLALIGVLSWRVINFWIPIPVAGLCWLSLGRSERRTMTGSMSTPRLPG